MKEELKNIIAGRGLGSLKFGQSRDQVKTILGDPDEIETDSFTESEEDLIESWHYDELELSLSFDEEDDWKLITIAVSADFYRFKNLNIIGMKKADLMNELKKLKIQDLEYEDCSTEESPTHELYSSDSLGMNFWLDESEVTEIQWGPLLKDKYTIIWPK